LDDFFLTKPLEAEAEAEAYYGQSAGMVIPGIEP
jgi:hypothetical protein